MTDQRPEPDLDEAQDEQVEEQAEEREPVEEAADGLPTDTGRLHE